MSIDRPEVVDTAIGDYKGPTKFLPCRRCTVPIEVPAATVNPPRHFNCSIQDMVDAMHQMKAKRGPVYDRYINGMRVYAERIARTPQP